MPILAAKSAENDPKIDQNRTQNESKFKTMFKSEKVALQEHLGAVLGRSWDVLEAILGAQWHPSSAKTGPDRVSKAYQHQKREFSPNTTPTDTGALSGTPG